VAVGSRKLAAVGLAAAIAVSLSACGEAKGGKNEGKTGKGAGYNAALEAVVNPSDKKGGTLDLWSPQDADSWDPGRGYYAFMQDLSRLYARTLVTYKPAPGTEGLELVPDLATAMPEVSADGKTYTFTLKDGLKWEDGSPITSKDIKYAVERTFAQDVLSGGPIYFVQELEGGEDYKGPYKDKNPEGLKSIQTPDDKTVVFKLKTRNPDFPYQLAMATGAPVPRSKDTGAKYGNHPFSSGPYKFESYQPGKSLVLVRNEHWDQKTDTVRKALPDKIKLTITTNADDMDKRLLAHTADLDVSGTGLQQAAQVEVLRDPELKANADDAITAFWRYIAMSTKVAPFDNVHCRKAVIYAADPAGLVRARGGDYAGTIATNALPPSVSGSEGNAYDPYGLAQGKPQIEKAKEELKACGKPDGFTTHMAVRNNKDKDVKMAVALQASLKTIGVDAILDQYDGKLVPSTVGSPDNVHKKNYGLIVMGWGPDYPTGSGMLQPLVDGRLILPNGNNNFTEINDPLINGLFDKGAQEKTAEAAAEDYKQVNHRVMEQALYIPGVFEKALIYRNPRLTNVYLYAPFGMVDLQALGVSDGK
jgi:peptide/nickel transport system substrate-binding protein